MPDSLDRAAARGRIAAQLFGERPQAWQLGRYRILDRVGAGAMGIVYSAYDPQLDRRVALKVLQGDGATQDSQAHASLLREARALGQLTHPNVVPVHDVAVIDGHVVVVMEFVVGLTLTEWAETERRSWRDVVAVYLQAARGLAAAHRVGMVHRDFKPDNALIGDDDRVRVVDFGLARFSRPSADVASTDLGAFATRAPAGSSNVVPGASDSNEYADPTGSRGKTGGHAPGGHGASGALASAAAMGTPRFMAPEQFTHGGVGPAADQFSFCVALYRALFQQWPFGADDDFATLAENVRQGRVRPPPGESDVPRRIQAAVLRGLRSDPGGRFATMDELIDELAYDPGRTRRRWLTVAAGIGLLGLGFASARAWLGTDGAAPCRGAEAAVAAVWDAPRRATVTATLQRTDSPHARAAAAAVVRGLDEFANGWSSTHRNACLAHQRGEESDDLFDRRMTCLEGRLETFASVVTALGNARDRIASVDDAADAVSELPLVSHCEDTEAMKAQVAPPDDPELRAAVDELRSRVNRALVLEQLGRHDEALATAQAAVGDAKRMAYPPTLAEAHLALGRVRLMRGEEDAAIEPLQIAERIGLGQGQLSLAVEASARRFFAQAQYGVDLPAVVEQARIVEPLSQRVEDGGFARPLLLNNLGVVNMALGQREQATGYFLAAYDALPAADRRVPELNAVVGNLAMVAGDPGERESYAAESYRQLRGLVGEHHPKTLTALVGYSHASVRLADAVDRALSACRSYDRHHPARVPLRVPCWYFAGFLLAEHGQSDAALDAYERSVGAPDGHASIDSDVWVDLARGNAALLRGQIEDAGNLFRATKATMAAYSDVWWNQQRKAHAALGLGQVEIAALRFAQAVPHLTEAVAALDALTAINEDMDHQRRLALARFLLARAFAETDRCGSGQCAELLRQARDWYRRTDPAAYGARLARIDSLLETATTAPGNERHQVPRVAPLAAPSAEP